MAVPNRAVRRKRYLFAQVSLINWHPAPAQARFYLGLRMARLGSACVPGSSGMSGVRHTLRGMNGDRARQPLRMPRFLLDEENPRA